MGFTLNVDMSEVLELAKMKDGIEAGIKQAAKDLAEMTKMHLIDLAKQKLKSRAEMYIEGLSTYKLSDTVWVVSLSSKVRWIEEGQRSYSLLEGLLRSKNVKTAKDGTRYTIVPFEHGPGKGPAAEGGLSGPTSQDLIGEIKAEMKRRKLPAFGKMEKDASGAPLLGKLHSFDIMHAPKKTAEGIGQGRGPIGRAREGITGIPFLQGVNVYQKEFTDKKTGVKGVRRSIVTFRIASEKHQGGGRWEHPGNDPVSLMEDAVDWAREQWDSVIAPAMLATIYASLD